MPSTAQHGIVWQKCNPGNHYAKRFFVPKYEGYLPFFLSGNELDDLENKRDVALREKHLLKGIFYGLYDLEHNPKSWHQEEDKETLIYLIDILRNGFHYDNPETMILDIASSIREENGSLVSRIVLDVGNKLLPRSSKIKSDLICDLWAVVSEKGENKEIFKKIVALIPQINFLEIQSDAKEVVCYYGLCALFFLDDKESISKYLPKYVYPNIKIRKLKNNVIAIMKNRKKFSPGELRIT